MASSTEASSVASASPMAAAPRRRWKKALSLASATSTERCTDLEELDMDAVIADGALTHSRNGYCGYIHVAYMTKAGHISFVKRFCRLEELVCKLYESEKHLSPLNRHVIISVKREQSRNKSFSFVDYEDRTVLLHTCMGADFELWFGTFAAIVKTTQVAKSRVVETKNRRRTNRRATTSTPRKNAAKVHENQRFRALTAPDLVTAEGWVEDSREQEQVAVLVDQDDPERTHTAWLYVQAPWWRQILFRRQHLRRYFVFSGTSVSCFSVNKEGKRSMFTYTMTACTYGNDVLELECGNLHKLRLHGSNSNTTAVAATAKYVRKALEMNVASFENH
ncbi:hypothetical protein PHYBOEH_002860 [Phytophthora boehmeriae]|uniref:PH domain-containing protein n=1 Tax=Phytophthora boehmeriae TaxID=109152 RepID=A0A8T1WQ54_9STRA|nr:hypothetical protein PHYBOEH_002860 [Phytophthora boehmeriae]